MSEQPLEQQPEAAQSGGIVDQVNGDVVAFGPGLARTVIAKNKVELKTSAVLFAKSEGDVDVSYGGGGVLVAGGNSRITNGGAQIMVNGGNQEITNGGAQIMVNGGNLEMTNGGAQFLVAGGSATVHKGIVGVILSANVTLGEGSKVLLNTPQALAFGAAFGLFYGLARWLSRRKG